MNKKDIKFKKKGNVFDMFIVIIMLFMAIISIFVVHIMLNTVDETGIFDDYTSAKENINYAKSTATSFDNLVIFIIVGLSLYVIITSAVVWNHPAFFIIGLVMLSIAIVFAAIVSNAFYDFSTESEILDTRLAYPKIIFLMENLPIYVLIMGIAASISSYVGYIKQ